MLKSFFRKISEKKAIKSFYSIPINENDIVIDCGANIGKITEYLASKNARVYAFEPNPYAFKVLSEKFTNNNNVICINKGVYSKNTTAKLFLHKNSDIDKVCWSTGSSIIKEKRNINVNNSIEIDLIDLTSFITKLNQQIKLIKIDVEGAECEIIKKIIEKGLTHSIDYIFIETHDNKIPELRKKTDEIRRLIKTKKIKNINLNWS